MHQQSKQEIKHLIWRLTFADSVWRCGITGKEITIPADFKRGDFFSFGKDASFIDVGDIYYSRMGGNPIFVSSPYQHIVDYLTTQLEEMERDNVPT